jgi:hypothetical protein
MVFKKHENVVTREIVGETILVPIRRKLVDMQKLFCLNPVAAFVWERLDGRRTLGEVRDAVLEAFEVAPGEAEADIRAFIAELAAADLIQEAT